MSADILLGLVGLILTLMVFSYIFGDNLFFRVALTILAAVSAGYTAAVLITKVIIPLLIHPLGATREAALLWMVFPLLLAVLVGLMIFPRLSKLGKIPLSFLVGVFAALTIFGVVRGTLAPQLLAVINRFSPELLQNAGLPDWARIVWAVMVLLGVIAVLLAYQHYTHKRKADEAHASLLDGVGSIGQIFVGITLGATFVMIFSTALVALISRVVWIKDFLAGLL